MKENIIKGLITNMETGEGRLYTHYLFCHEYELRTIVKINQVENFVLPDNSFQICIGCWGIDSIGGVFEVELAFTPSTPEERDKILRELEFPRYCRHS